MIKDLYLTHNFVKHIDIGDNYYKCLNCNIIMVINYDSDYCFVSALNKALTMENLTCNEIVINNIIE